MKRRNYNLVFILFLLNIAFFGCNGNKNSDANDQKQEETVVVKEPVPIDNETLLLLKDLEENGNYINSQQYPSLIKASIVYENLGNNMLVIDIRSSKAYSEGHIKGAVNKSFNDLPEYFESGIKPFEYDKIIIASDDGQLSSYTTSLLRLMGYGNVFSMRWGMSAWNDKFAKTGWLSGVNGKFESSLEKSVNEKGQDVGMPALNTGKATGEEIADERFYEIFKEGSDNVLITAEEVFANPAKYYVINLDRRDKYEDGHVPGAVRYKPDATLGFTSEMATIPFDRTVVVYCGTGHNSGFATAFLRLFGYDARTLKYGNNGFMYDKMVEQRTAMSWLPFTNEDVNDFPVVK